MSPLSLPWAVKKVGKFSEVEGYSQQGSSYQRQKYFKRENISDKPTEGFNNSKGPGYSALACLDVYSSERKMVLFITVPFFRKHSRDYNLKELTYMRGIITII